MASFLLVEHDEPRLAALVRAQEADVMQRYGVNDAGPGLGPGATCLLAVVEDEAAGCVALTQLSPGVGEVKRMYVAPSHRGRRLAARLLEGIEAQARSAGMTSLRLEAGTEQPEALAVYRRAGYEEIECYGYFAADPTTICFEKRLSRPWRGGVDWSVADDDSARPLAAEVRCRVPAGSARLDPCGPHSADPSGGRVGRYE